jgi:beta-lactamase regulating signal transducer with metallopeptidase domain
MNIPNDLMITLAWSLLHFLWQGALIAAVAAGLMFAFRRPATRYLLGLGALSLMFASFGVTFMVLNSPAAVDTAPAVAPAAALAMTPDVGSDPAAIARAAPTTESPREILWLAQGWLAGVFLLAVRLAFGLLVIEYLRRRNLVALPDALVARLHALQARLGLTRLIRYRECALVGAPAVIGFFRPIVLIPMRAITGLSTEQLEAVIAHELGHVKRFDVAVNFVQVIAETVFFFHPAVWWLNRRIRADREDCCDDIAVNAAGGRLGYAKALATMATWRDTPRFAMAATGGPLAARVSRLLGMTREPHQGRMAGAVTITLLAATATLACAISFGLVNPAVAQPGQAAQNPAAQANPPSPDMPPPVSPPPPPAAYAPVVAQTATPARAAQTAQTARPAPNAEPAPAPRPARTARTAAATEPGGAGASYLETMRKSGIEFDVDQLVAMKIHGVTPEYIDAMRATGLKIDAESLIALRIHDVNPDFVASVRAQGFSPGADEIVAFRIHGITPEYVKSLRDLGISPDVDQVVALAIHRVTAEYVRQMRAAGFDPDTEGLIAMKIHGVTPELRKAFEAGGYELDVEQLVHAQVMGVTPEFIAKARSHGFDKLSFDQLIHLKRADVL